MYRKRINDTETKRTYFIQDNKAVEVILAVGNKYEIVFKKPTTKKDRHNNGRIVELLGFNDSFGGDVIVRYLDNNRIGRQVPNCLFPYEEQSDCK